MKKKKFDLYKTLRIVFLMLAILTMAMSIVGKGHAEELPVELQEQIINILDNDLNVSVNQSYLDNCFSCPYCAVYNINNGSHNIYYFDFYFTKYIGYLYERYGGRYYYATSMYFEYTGSNRGYISCSPAYDGTVGTGYRIIVDGTRYYFGSVTATSSNVVQSTNFNITGLPSTYSDTYGYDIYSNSTSSYTYNVLISYGNCYLQHGSAFAVHEDTWEPVSFDDNFSIYKTYGVGGIDDPILNIEYLDNIFSQGYVYTDSTTYSLTFDVDGVESTVSISSTTYPDEFVEHSGLRTSFDLIYRMLSNKILNFSSASTVTLKQVSMTATAYPTSNQQGTPETVTKSTLCNLTLKGGGTGDYEIENIPTINDVSVSYDKVFGSTAFSLHTGSSLDVDDLPPYCSHFKVLIYQKSIPSGFDTSSYNLSFKSSAFQSMVATTEVSNTDWVWNGWFGVFLPSTTNYNILAQPDYYGYMNFLVNKYFDNYDVLTVTFIFGENDVSAGTVANVVTYNLFNESYYSKMIIQSMGDIQDTVQSGAYYTKGIYLYIKSRMDNMIANQKSYYETDNQNSTVANQLLTSINTNLISVMAYIEGLSSKFDLTNSKLDSIITALNNLSLGGSSITPSQLTTVLTDLFLPHYQYIEPSFNEYKSQLGILALPFDYSSEVYDTIKSNYSDKMELTIPSASFKADSSTEYIVMQGFDWEFEPETLFSENESIHSIFTSIQYLNAFLAILGASWFTYCHIFRRNETNDN